jgi:glycosyltransferase involved in cell wall biosynthesis
LIIVPAWNEERSVGNTVREIRTALPEVDVLVVDDGSTDETVRVAREAGAVVLELSYNLGVGGAMRAGFRYALRHGYDTTVQVDADGQHNPHEVPRLLAKLGEADVVIGARFDGDDDYQVRGPRKWAMVVLAKVISRLARTPLTDTTSGFRASGRRALPLFAQYYPVEYLGDTIESLVIALRAGCRVAQVPTRMRPRSDGRPSHRPLKASIYLFRAGFALLLALVRRWDVSVQEAAFAATGPAEGGAKP